MSWDVKWEVYHDHWMQAPTYGRPQYLASFLFGLKTQTPLAPYFLGLSALPKGHWDCQVLFWSQPIYLPACTLTPWNSTDYVFSFCCFTRPRKMKRIYLLSVFSFLESTFWVAFQLHFHGMALTRFFPYCSFSPGWSSLWTFPLMEYSWGMWPVQSIGKLVHLKSILIYHCPQSASGFLEPNCFTLCFTSRVWSLKHQGIFSNEVLGQSFHPAFL